MPLKFNAIMDVVGFGSTIFFIIRFHFLSSVFFVLMLLISGLLQYFGLLLDYYNIFKNFILIGLLDFSNASLNISGIYSRD